MAAPAPIRIETGKEVFTSPAPIADTGDLAGMGASWKALGTLGNELHGIGERILKPEMEARGAAEVQRDDEGNATFVPRTPLNDLDAAYNAGGLNAFAVQADTAIRQKLIDLRNETPLDPQAFQKAGEAYVRELAGKAGTPSVLREDILNQGRGLIVGHTASMQDHRRAVDTRTQIDGLKSNIRVEADATLFPLARQFGTESPQFLASVVRIKNLHDALKSPQYEQSPDELENEFKGIMAEAKAEAGTGAALKVYEKSGKAAALKVGDGYFYSEGAGLAPDISDKYSNRLRNMINQREADQRAAHVQEAQAVEGRTQDAAAAASNGEDWERIVPRSVVRNTLGDEAVDQLDLIADTHAATNWVKSASPAEIAARQKELDPHNLDMPGSVAGPTKGYGYAADLRRHNAFNAAVKQHFDGLESDPAGYTLAASPVLQGLGIAAQNDPRQNFKFVSALLAEQDRLGVPTGRQRILSKRDEDFVSNQMLAGGPDQAVKALGRLTTGLRPDQLGILARQIAPKNRAIGAAVSLSANNPALARDVLIGEHFLQQNPDAKPADRILGTSVDRATGGSSGWFGRQTGGLFEFAPDARESVRAASAALYARYRMADKPGTLDQGALDGAVKEVIGNPFAFRGQVIVPPKPTMTATDLNGLMNRIDDKAIQAFGNGKPIDASGRPVSAAAIAKQGVLTYTGTAGIYRVRFPGQGHIGVQGNSGARTFMIDLGRMNSGASPDPVFADAPALPPVDEAVIWQKVKTKPSGFVKIKPGHR